MFRINEENGLNALYGGWFLGGGGGGSIEGGKDMLKTALAYGGFDVCSVDELEDDDLVLTGSLVGSPSAGKVGITGEHCARCYEIYKLNTGIEPKALISNESGAQSITNGWIAAAVNKLPVVDAACNGRAHPTGTMGAMGLDTLNGYRSVQSAVGGNGEHYLEMCVSGTIESTSQLVRNASIETKGFISVLRNPATAAYIKQNSAVGTLSMCIDIGAIVRKFENKPDDMVAALKDKLDMRLLTRGKVSSFKLECKGGFDVGSFMVNNSHEVTYWNEYMTAEADGKRIATFPDLIMLLDGATGLPVCSAAVKDDMDVMLVNVPKAKLLLGKAMFLRHLFLPCESAVEKPLVKYVFE